MTQPMGVGSQWVGPDYPTTPPTPATPRPERSPLSTVTVSLANLRERNTPRTRKGNEKSEARNAQGRVDDVADVRAVDYVATTPRSGSVRSQARSRDKSTSDGQQKRLDSPHRTKRSRAARLSMKVNRGDEEESDSDDSNSRVKWRIVSNTARQKLTDSDVLAKEQSGSTFEPYAKALSSRARDQTIAAGFHLSPVPTGYDQEDAHHGSQAARSVLPEEMEKVNTWLRQLRQKDEQVAKRLEISPGAVMVETVETTHHIETSLVYEDSASTQPHTIGSNMIGVVGPSSERSRARWEREASAESARRQSVRRGFHINQGSAEDQTITRHNRQGSQTEALLARIRERRIASQEARQIRESARRNGQHASSRVELEERLDSRNKSGPTVLPSKKDLEGIELESQEGESHLELQALLHQAEQQADAQMEQASRAKRSQAEEATTGILDNRTMLDSRGKMDSTAESLGDPHNADDATVIEIVPQVKLTEDYDQQTLRFDPESAPQSDAESSDSAWEVIRHDEVDDESAVEEELGQRLFTQYTTALVSAGEAELAENHTPLDKQATRLTTPYPSRITIGQSETTSTRPRPLDPETVYTDRSEDENGVLETGRHLRSVLQLAQPERTLATEQNDTGLDGSPRGRHQEHSNSARGGFVNLPESAQTRTQQSVDKAGSTPREHKSKARNTTDGASQRNQKSLARTSTRRTPRKASPARAERQSSLEYSDGSDPIAIKSPVSKRLAGPIQEVAGVVPAASPLATRIANKSRLALLARYSQYTSPVVAGAYPRSEKTTPKAVEPMPPSDLVIEDSAEENRDSASDEDGESNLATEMHSAIRELSKEAHPASDNGSEDLWFETGTDRPVEDGATTIQGSSPTQLERSMYRSRSPTESWTHVELSDEALQEPEQAEGDAPAVENFTLAAEHYYGSEAQPDSPPSRSSALLTISCNDSKVAARAVAILQLHHGYILASEGEAH